MAKHAHVTMEDAAFATQILGTTATRGHDKCSVGASRFCVDGGYEACGSTDLALCRQAYPNLTNPMPNGYCIGIGASVDGAFGGQCTIGIPPSVGRASGWGGMPGLSDTHHNLMENSSRSFQNACDTKNFYFLQSSEYLSPFNAKHNACSN